MTKNIWTQKTNELENACQPELDAVERICVAYNE